MKEDKTIWEYILKHRTAPLLQVGDNVKIKDALINSKLYSVLGNNVHTVDEIRLVKNWKWLPFQQFIGLSGNQNDLLYNTVLKKI